MSCNFASSRSVTLQSGLLLCAAALAFSGVACVNAQITPGGGSGGGNGQGGAGLTGMGGSDATGGAGGDTGTGGDGTGGKATGGNGAGGAATGGTGAGGAATGGNGMGGAGTGGAIVDAGVDVPYDGPTGITPYAAGQLVITEIMADTNDVPDESGEWFELYNLSTTDTYDLFGCVLADSANQDTVMNHVLIPPISYVTLARFGTAAGGFVPTYDYHTTLDMTGVPNKDADVKFSNDMGDSAHVTCGIVEIDRVDFHTWLGSNVMVPNGRSYSLDPTHYSATENDVEGNWCVGTNVYHSTDRGTPGQPNPPCSCIDGAADGGCMFF